MNAFLRSSASCVFIAALAACGSGGGAGSPLNTPVPVKPATATFEITIPAKGAAGSVIRRPNYVSSNTQSMTVSVNRGALQYIGLTPATNPNCTGDGVTTPITCTHLSVAAAPGSDVFAFNLYATALVGGTLPPNAILVSKYTTPPIQIIAGQDNQLGSFTLNPVLASASLVLTLPPSGFPVGSLSCTPVSVTGKDGSGATIIGSAPWVDSRGAQVKVVVGTDLGQPYVSAFTFSPNDCTARTSSFYVFNGPGQTANLIDTGIIHPAFNITADGAYAIKEKIPVAIATSTPVMVLTCAQTIDACTNTLPNPTASFVQVSDTASIALSETGWTEAPYSEGLTLSGDTCNQADSPGAGGNWASFTPGKGSVGTAFSVQADAIGTPGNPATCLATFVDPLGGHITMAVQVTGSSVGVQ